MGTTAAQKKLFFNLRRLKGQMQAIEDGDLQPEQVAKIATRAGRAGAGRGQHEPPPRRAGPQPERAGPRRIARASGRIGWSTSSKARKRAIADREELTGRKALLAGALKTLNERERHILIERRLKDNPTTLEELSQQYGISRERVRQIEVRAFEKLQKAMKAQIAERRMHASTLARQPMTASQ